MLMRTTLTVALATFLISQPAIAGGLLGDAIEGLGLSSEISRQMDEANKTLVKPSDSTDDHRRIEQSIPNYTISDTCLTPQGSCTSATAAISGSRCFCDFPSGVVFGAIE